MSYRTALGPLVLAALTACGGTSDPGDAGTLTDAHDERDAVTPDAGPLDCAAQLAERAPLPLAPSFRRTQIHPAAAFDGEHIWVTLTVAEEAGSTFDIVLLPLGCDGTPGAPIPVDDEIEPNDIDASLAIFDDTLLVAWQRDRGEGTIATWTRAFALDGTPRAPSAELTTTREGAPVVGTHWFPQLVAISDGFALVGSRGVEATSNFQVFVQRFDASGAPVGDTLEPATDAERSQTSPSAAWDGSALHVGLDASPLEGASQAVYVAPGGATRDLASIGSSATPSLAWVSDRVLVAHDSATAVASGISLVDPSDDSRVRVSDEGAGAFLASGGVLWLEGFRGFSASRIEARAVSSSLELGPVVSVPTTAGVPGPYRPGLLTLEGELHLVVFSEGTSPNFEARAAFIRLPAP